MIHHGIYISPEARGTPTRFPTCLFWSWIHTHGVETSTWNFQRPTPLGRMKSVALGCMKSVALGRMKSAWAIAALLVSAYTPLVQEHACVISVRLVFGS